ncbi:hypothetical protein BCT47_25055 [Vibrio splendidus]|uniref:hypothetical protein n=1 Tax=Vibrio TaxID=662 RepID=UPI000C816715|nr:hypothetical protein [Vibrio splendidus]PMM73041.1 hypothetical protein BCT47_25055 [Vibrio splendidus]CAK2061509.1 conserved hypothetical protein [Vibrio crassostreae]
MDSFDSNNEDQKNSIEDFLDRKREIKELIERLASRTGLSKETIRQFLTECELEGAADISVCVEEKIKNELAKRLKNKPNPEEQDTDKPTEKKTKPKIK